jgi:excisionase family DNA binding protein
MASPVSERQLVTPREAAEFLRLSERSVRRLIDAGVLRAYRVGGPGASLRIDRAELLDALRPARGGEAA